MSSRKLAAAALLTAALGGAGITVGLVTDPRRAWLSYLQAWTFAVSVAVGALLFLMMSHAAKAGWMVVTRRISESICSVLPVHLALFGLLTCGLAFVYPWDARQPLGAVVRRGYLSAAPFVVRSLLYFGIFIGVASCLRAWSRSNDDRPRPEAVRRMRRLGAGALPVVALALTGASFDWTMSLEPEWGSTIFGLYFFAGSFVGAIALVAIFLHFARVRDRSPVTADHAHALGRVLFAMVVFWAYMAFSQLLIYWIADIPDEVAYYALRTSGSWAWVTTLLVVGMFVLPFFALLGRRLKRNTATLAAIAAWIFIMHYVDVYWMVMPAHQAAGARPHWLDLAAVLFVGGLSAAWILHDYRRAAPLPRHVPELADGLDYEAAL